MKINDVKYLIKEDPRIIIRKPWVLAYIPLITAKIFFNNLRLNTDRVYFVETQIDNYLKLNTCLINKLSGSDNLKLSKINSFEMFNQILIRRLNEDSSAGLGYELSVRDRFLNESEAYVIFENEIPLGYIFIQKKQTRIPQVRLNIQMDEFTFAFIDLYIFKIFRGRKYYEILYTETINCLKKSGFRCFYCWLMEHNQVSIKAHINIGISQITKIITRKSFLFFSVTKIKENRINLAALIK